MLNPFLGHLKIVFLSLNTRKIFQAVLTEDVDLKKFNYNFFSAILIVFNLFVKNIKLWIKMLITWQNLWLVIFLNV